MNNSIYIIPLVILIFYSVTFLTPVDCIFSKFSQTSNKVEVADIDKLCSDKCNIKFQACQNSCAIYKADGSVDSSKGTLINACLYEKECWKKLEECRENCPYIRPGT